MTTELWYIIAGAVIDAIAIILAAVANRRKNKEYKIEEFADKVAKVNTKVQKYVDKQCKKNKIEISDLTNKVEE